MLDLPKVDRRQNIGLIGGSFDPPHEGHMHVAKWALRSLPLDKLWWVVSKRNPLKKQSTTDFKNRIKNTQKLVKQPKMLVTDLEAVFDTEFTVDFLSKVKSEYPKGNFIWIMGADGLNNFHEWKHWEKIFEMIYYSAMETSMELSKKRQKKQKYLTCRMFCPGAQNRYCF